MVVVSLFSFEGYQFVNQITGNVYIQTHSNK